MKLPPLVAFGVALLSAAAAYLSTQAATPLPGKLSARLGRCRFSLEVAIDGNSASVGLMHRTTLPNNSGMVFLVRRQTAFWMKDTLIPLSILFIDRAGVVVDAQEMSPLSLTEVRSRANAQFAIEGNAGNFQRCGATRGTLTDIPADLAKRLSG